ncbi:hypothetical protein Tco_0355506 [Tanacetum coccineum]
MNFNLNNENDPWELSLDIDDFDLHLTPVLCPSSSTRVEPSPSTPNPVRIIPGPAGIVQAAKLLKQRDILLGLDEAVMSTQEYMKKVVKDVGEDEDFKSGVWVSLLNIRSGIMGIDCGAAFVLIRWFINPYNHWEVACGANVKTFTRTPSVIYQNFLREFWCTAIAYDPSPPANDYEVRPLKEFKIKFSMMNGKKPLTLDFKTFTESTGLNYYDGT